MRLALHQRNPLSLCGRNVARDLRRPFEPPRAIPDRGDSKGHIDDFAVLAAAARLIALDPFAAADALQYLSRLALIPLGQQLEHRLADHLFGSVAEDRFGAAVPVGYDAVQPFADDGVVGRGDDGGETTIYLLIGVSAPDADQNAIRFDRRSRGAKSPAARFERVFIPLGRPKAEVEAFEAGRAVP